MPINESVKVTIVIPNYNYGKWVKNAILSVLNDPYPNKQIMVVDDGSTDSSWPIICKTLNLKNVIPGKVLEGEVEGVKAFAARMIYPTGPSYARNVGIEALYKSTDLFGFLDSDDEYRNGKISLSVKKFLTDPEHIGAIYTDYDTIDSEGIIKRDYKEPFNRERLINECIVHSACMVNKEAIIKVGMYDPEMRTCEDYDLWMRISEAYCLIHIPEPLMLVRVGSHNSTATVPSEIWQKNWQRVMTKTQERLNAR